MNKTITHNFEYSVEDIKNLIKKDIAKRLKMETIPIIDYSIHFRVDMENDPSDWRCEYPSSPVMKGAVAKVEVPG